MSCYLFLFVAGMTISHKHFLRWWQEDRNKNRPQSLTSWHLNISMCIRSTSNTSSLLLIGDTLSIFVACSNSTVLRVITAKSKQDNSNKEWQQSLDNWFILLACCVHHPFNSTNNTIRNGFITIIYVTNFAYLKCPICNIASAFSIMAQNSM